MGGVLFLLGALLTTILQEQIESEGVAILLTDWRAVGLAALMVLLGAAGLWLPAIVPLHADTGVSVGERIREVQAIALRNSASAEAALYYRFLEQVARALTRLPYPRALIVDRHGGLDPLSRSVLDLYISEYASIRRSELWCIFERTDESTASRLWHVNRVAYGHRRTSVFRHVPLTPDEREKLALFVGSSERQRFHRVQIHLRLGRGQSPLPRAEI